MAFPKLPKQSSSMFSLTIMRLSAALLVIIP